MSLVTVAQVREHVPTDLVDAALQRVIDAVEELLDDRVGALNSETEAFLGETSTTLYLRRPALSLTTVTTYASGVPTVLATTDYELRDGRTVVLASASIEKVVVTYVPKAGVMQRILATIDLVRLSVQETGLSSASDGDHSETRLDIAKERRRIIETLRSSHRMFV